MDDKDIKELLAMMTDWAHSKGYETKHLLAFLTATFVGTMEMDGKSQEFMNATCDRMKDHFKAKRAVRLQILYPNQTPAQP